MSKGQSRFELPATLTVVIGSFGASFALLLSLRDSIEYGTFLTLAIADLSAFIVVVWYSVLRGYLNDKANRRKAALQNVHAMCKSILSDFEQDRLPSSVVNWDWSFLGELPAELRERVERVFKLELQNHRDLCEAQEKILSHYAIKVIESRPSIASAYDKQQDAYGSFLKILVDLEKHVLKTNKDLTMSSVEDHFPNLYRYLFELGKSDDLRFILPILNQVKEDKVVKGRIKTGEALRTELTELLHA